MEQKLVNVKTTLEDIFKIRGVHVHCQRVEGTNKKVHLHAEVISKQWFKRGKPFVSGTMFDEAYKKMLDLGYYLNSISIDPVLVEGKRQKAISILFIKDV